MLLIVDRVDTTPKHDKLQRGIFSSSIKPCTAACKHLLTRWSSWSGAAEHWPHRPAARGAGRADSPPRGPLAAAGGPPQPSRRFSGGDWTGLDWTGGVDGCRVKQHGPEDVAMLTGQQQRALLLLLLPPSPPPPTSLASSPDSRWINSVQKAVQQNYVPLPNTRLCMDMNEGGRKTVNKQLKDAQIVPPMCAARRVMGSVRMCTVSSSRWSDACAVTPAALKTTLEKMTCHFTLDVWVYIYIGILYVQAIKQV